MSPDFSVRWRGYDRAEVDQFLRETEADRRRLQDSLAQLDLIANFGENGRRELHRLTTLRREIAGCLETSIAALHTATDLLSSAPGANSGEEDAVIDAVPAGARVPFGRRAPATVAGSAAVCGLVAAVLLFEPRARAIPMPPPPPPAPIALAAKSKPAVINQGLLLTLTARRSCWVGTSIDGGQPLERLLAADETILLRADKEVLLRVGDAGALSLMINSQPAKPLGGSGQVTTARITRANYAAFLTSD